VEEGGKVEEVGAVEEVEGVEQVEVVEVRLEIVLLSRFLTGSYVGPVGKGLQGLGFERTFELLLWGMLDGQEDVNSPPERMLTASQELMICVAS